MSTVEINGVETYYERHGAGHPVVLIHGGGWDRRCWAGQVETFADDYEVIVYDVRGHGRTGGSDREDYSIELFAEDLRALVDALDLDAPVVGGVSLGGMIAHTYAATYPEEVSGLVAVEAAVEYDLRGRKELLASMMGRLSDILGVRYALALWGWIQRLRGNEVGEDLSEPMPGLDMTAGVYMAAVEEQVDDEESAKLESAPEDLQNDDLASIDVPTLVVTGKDPHRMIAEGRAAMEREIDDVRAVAIEGAGHAVNIDRPEPFDEELRQFLEDTVGAPAA